MLNWVLDETKPSAHVQHPWKSIHPHNVFHNARETFDMSYLGLNKWNRTSNLEQDPVFPYRRDFSIHVNENNIKNETLSLPLKDEILVPWWFDKYNIRLESFLSHNIYRRRIQN